MEFLHRQLMLSDIVAKNDNTTGVKVTKHGYGNIAIYLDIAITNPNGGIATTYIKKEHKELLIGGIISSLKAHLIIGENSEKIYGFEFDNGTKKVSFFTFTKSNAKFEYVDFFNFDSKFVDFYVYYKENVDNPNLIDFYIKPGIVSTIMGYESLEPKLYQFDNSIGINIQLGFGFYYSNAITDSGLMISFVNINIATDISNLSGSTGFNIDPSKATYTAHKNEGGIIKKVKIIDEGCLLDSQGVDWNAFDLDFNGKKVLTDLNLVSEPMTLEIPQDVIPDWVSVGEAIEEEVQ